MIDIKLLRSDKERIFELLRRRKEDFDLEKILELDSEKRILLREVESMKNHQNNITKDIAGIKNNGGNPEDMFLKMREMSQDIKNRQTRVRELDCAIEKEMLLVPNIPDISVPEGESDEDNVEIRKWGEIREFDFEPSAHWDIGERLKLFDPIRAAKTTSSRYVFYLEYGAKIERALINFFLDTHALNGYKEVLPPYIVNRESMTGVGQLPKFEDAAFKIDNNFFLIPTAEVPVTNMYRDYIFDEEELPIKHSAYSACFRSEAGSACRDTRGLIRQHQFNKVELVKFVKPESGYDELESLVLDAERILQILNLPYRVVRICMGDLGFQASLKYDLEVWMPSYNRYVEISSCSLFRDFQSRRINIKYRNKVSKKNEFVYTINGSGLAVGRTFAAILENFQNEDGGITLPSALGRYLGNLTIV